MYGVPGFESSELAEQLAFDRVTEDEAIAIARYAFGSDASAAQRLDTERDDSFRLRTAHGDWVLKVAHPADDASVIGGQLRALEHATNADPALPLPRIVPSTSGAPLHVLASGRVAWMFEWMNGTLLRDAAEGPPEFEALGTALGRLSLALRSFPQDGSARPSAWDLQTVPRLATLLGMFPDTAVGEAIARYTERVVPRIGELPRQAIHNDFNPGNVLVDPGREPYVVGIIDFGDIVYSLRVADLAVALAYQISPLRHSMTDVAPMIAAFDWQVGLTVAEREVLSDLVAARFAQRILINQWIGRDGLGHDAMLDPNRAALAALLDLEG